MKTRWMAGWMVVGGLLIVAQAWATPMGTAFTYQGFLEKPAGTPLTNSCDFRFYLIDAPLAGNIVGDSPQVAAAVAVVSGNFSVPIDFGEGAFTGEARWITIEVKCPGDGAYVLMTPAVELTPAPYALALPGLRTPQTATVLNVIGGGPENTMAFGVEGGTIAGGGIIGPSSQWNAVLGDGGAIGGGTGNTADRFATVAGGYNNHANGTSSAVGGGEINLADGAEATVGGGTFNGASGDQSTVGGGRGNGATGESGTVGGGRSNLASGASSAVGGGELNSAVGENSVVSGGRDNNAEGLGSSVVGGSTNDATGNYATVAGGSFNDATESYPAIGGGLLNGASGAFSTVPGGHSNVAGGTYSFAAGRDAKVRDAATVGDGDGDQGTFVWADASGLDFTSSGANQFLIRAGGGVGINTNSPSSELEVAGDMELSGSMFVDIGTLVVDQPSHRVGIGTTLPSEKLHVAGNVRINNSLTVDNNVLVVDHTNDRVGVGTASPSSTLDVVGASELNGALTVDTSTLVVDAVNDRVGVGTSTPSSKLEIAAQDGLAITGFQPFLTLRDTNASNARTRIANAGGTFSFFPESFIGGNAAMVLTNSTGRLGIGTTTPGMSLEVATPSYYGKPTMGVADGSTGWAYLLADTVHHSLIWNSSTDMRFGTETSRGSGYAERMRLTGSGRLGIGDDTPDVALDVVGDIHYTGVITDVSDERMKEDIRPVERALDKVARLRGVTFAMKDSPTTREAGLIAQDVQGVLPEAVRVVDPDHGYLGVSYPSVLPLLVEAVKEMNGKIANVDAERLAATVRDLHSTMQDKECEIADLERRERSKDQRVHDLEARLAALEARMLEVAEAANGGGQ